MNSKKMFRIAAIVVCLFVGYFLITNIIFIYYLIAGTKYPIGKPLENMVIYKFDPETIQTSLYHGEDVFIPVDVNLSYDEAKNPSSWSQEDILRVAKALHQKNWQQPLDDWQLYSATFVLPNCHDPSQISGAGFRFYQNHKNWYYVFHIINIDYEYGYIYTGENYYDYTGQWKNIVLDDVMVKTAEDAFSIAELNGGQTTRTSMDETRECHIVIEIAPDKTFEQNIADWGWEVTYWVDGGMSVIYKIIVNPFTGASSALKK